MLRVLFLQQLYQDFQSSHAFQDEPKALYQPVNYILELGGKRMRPLLTLLAADLFGADPTRVLPVAHAIEVFHNFTLMHDDIMDHAPLRRGYPTAHTRFGLNAGILSGDVMLIHAYQFLLGLNDPSKAQVLVEIFNEVAVEVCRGQQYDMDFEQRDDVTIDEYLYMIELKTAALLGGALQLGAFAVGAPDRDINLLKAFGRHIGVAFQLQDDILDAFGDPEKFGKKPGGDIIQQKKTFLWLKAQQLADASTRLKLQGLLNDSAISDEVKVAEVVAIFKLLEIPALAAAEKSRFETMAFECLEAVNVPKNKKEDLLALTYQLMGREH